MLNLLTEAYKKEVLWEYRKRLIAICFFLITFAILIGGVSLIPTYLNILQKRSALVSDKEILQAKIDLAGDTDIVDKVKTLTRDTDALQPLQSVKISTILDRIISHADSVRLGHFTFAGNTDNTYSINFSGVSPSREALLGFSKILKSDSAFVYDEKSLPLSSFIKSKDIPFSIKMGMVLEKFHEN